MVVKNKLLSLAIAATCALGTGAAFAADYPTKPIHLIVPYSPGGAATVLARLIADKVKKDLDGQAVIVDNRPGAGASVGLEATAAAAPDGYTIGLSSSSMAVMPITVPSYKRDPVKDYTHITILSEGPFVFTVNPEVPAKTVNEFIAWAKANPGKVNSAASGITDRMIPAHLNDVAGIDITVVAYRGGAPSVTAMISGEVHAVFLPVVTVAPFINSGRARAIAVTTLRPSPLMEGTPTLAATIPGFSASFWFGISGPVGLQDDVVAKLRHAFTTALKDPSVIKQINLGGSDPVGSTTEEMIESLQTARKVWGPIASKMVAAD